MDFTRFLALFYFLGLLALLWHSALLSQGPTLRTWKATIHLGELMNPLALYLELLIARPRVVTRLRTRLGSLFMIFSYGLQAEEKGFMHGWKMDV
jgi:hypothetical protein